MDTVNLDDPATPEPATDTQATETTEETAIGDTSTDGEQEDAATLRKRLADKDRLITELRTKKPEEKPDTRSKEIKELEWKLENKERINLVKDDFEQILAEGFNGEKVSKAVALELAEKRAKVDTARTNRERSDDMTTPSATVRNTSPKGYEDELDEKLGLTYEKKKKLEERHPHLKLS